MTLQVTAAKTGSNNAMALEIALQLVQGHKDNAQKGLVALALMIAVDHDRQLGSEIYYQLRDDLTREDCLTEYADISQRYILVAKAMVKAILPAVHAGFSIRSGFQAPESGRRACSDPSLYRYWNARAVR